MDHNFVVYHSLQPILPNGLTIPNLLAHRRIYRPGDLYQETLKLLIIHQLELKHVERYEVPLGWVFLGGGL